MESLRTCLLYTSDAADDLLCVDLGGRRNIKKKKKHKPLHMYTNELQHTSHKNHSLTRRLHNINLIFW